ncbi:hypothetical protein PENTCL1PPCAC_9387, partial [Pristionchus entomophagus]
PASAAPSSAVFSLGASAGGGGAAAGGAAAAAPAAAPPLNGGFIADFSSDFFLPKHITTGLHSRRFDITGVLLGCLGRPSMPEDQKSQLACSLQSGRITIKGLAGGGGGETRDGSDSPR